jgi:predicted esterase
LASTAALTTMLVTGAAAEAASLYAGPGPRPGPALLYAKPATAPQLTNRKPFRAAPILVSGTTAYRLGEFIYQDFLYDDSGARGVNDTGDPKSSGNTFSRNNGTYTYPSADGYAENAADLVELRVKPVTGATLFRVTLNTLKDPSLVAFTIALGGTADETHAFPFGANVKAPANRFLTVHPDGKRLVGALTVAATGKANPGGAPKVSVDKTRRQITVRLPHAAWNPRRRAVRMAAGVGLWDAAAKAYLLPAASRSETRPGGAAAGGDPAAFFNVAFRTDEPIQKVNADPSVVLDAAWWRDKDQGNALAAGDISGLSATVSFAKLAQRVRDDSAVPRTGPMNRVLASRFELAQGADFSQNCLVDAEGCPGQYQGRLQPYAIYVPTKPRPASGYGMTLLMHSLGANYNQYTGTNNQSQFGERGTGSIVITPEARGPDGFYENYAAADVFEVWADVARRYTLDPDWTVATGYSMGGIGSFKLGAQFPDLFARIQPTVGNEGDNEVVASLRNVPVHMWNNHGDELVNDASFLQTANALDALGYRYTLDAFQPCANPACSPIFPNHLQLAINDQFAPMAEFLGTHRVERNPHHVTYVVFPSRDRKDLGVVGNHAYWASKLTLRDGAATGSFDAISRGFGLGDPLAGATKQGLTTLEGGTLGSLVGSRQGRTWGDAPAAERANRIDVTATGIAAATINVKRAKVDCQAEIKITSDGPLTVTLAGCRRTVSFP